MDAPRSHIQNNRAYYEVLAPGYDEATRDRYFVNDLVSSRLAEQPSLETVRSVLDLGSGTGLTLETVLKHIRPRLVVAVDFSSHMLELLKDKISIPELQTVRQDIDTYLAKNNTRFDLITAIGCLDLVPDPVKLLSIIGRHMADDGLCICTYEPRLLGVEDQSAAMTTYPRKLDDRSWELTVFRADTERIQQVLEAQQLVLVSDELVPAYPRGESVVRYGLLVVRKSRPSRSARS